jgi:hypothetical protein
MMVFGTPCRHRMRETYNSAVLLWHVEGVHQNEMSRLGKLVNDYPNGVKLVAGERQAHNEIHTDVFPFLGRNT